MGSLAVLRPLAPPEGRVQVVAVLNPFRTHERLRTDFSAGDTLAQIVDVLVPDAGRQEFLAVFIGPHFIPRAIWRSVRPKAGTTVLLRVVPQGPGLIGLVASLAGAATEAFLAGTALGSATFFGVTGAALAGAVVSFAILAVGQALFGPARPNRTEESPTYSITGSRNAARPHEPVPVVMGRHRMVPPYGAAPYTEAQGDDQFLRMLIVWGYGPVDVSDIKIGETSIDDFEDVEVEHDWDGAEASLDLYPTDAAQENLSVLLDTDYTSRTTQLSTTDIGVTVTFPTGLSRINLRTRDPVGYIVVLQGQYKKTTDVSWTDWFTEQVGDDTTQVTRWSKRIDGLPPGQYDVRLKRVDIDLTTFEPLDGFPAPYTDPAGYYVPWAESETRADILDTCYWTALRSFNANRTAVALSGVAKTAFRIRANDQLNGVVDQINAVVHRKTEVWGSGGWGGSETTRNPAALFRYVLKGAPNKQPVEAGDLDDDHLGYWYEFCEAQGFTYDAVIDYRASIRDLMFDIAAAGRASPTRIDGKWSVIIQEPKTTVVQHFTPRNSRNFQASIPFIEVPHALRIRFLNENRGWIEDERIVYDEGFDSATATRFQGIDLPGQTNPRNVRKLGRVFLAAARLRPESFSVEVDVEHLVATRGDLCRLQSDVALIGQTSGRIKAIAGDVITVDEEVTLASGIDYRVRVRKADGTTVTRDVEDVPGTYTALTLSSTSGLAVGDLFMFGQRVDGGESMEVVVRSIEYLDDLNARVDLVPYVEALYGAGDVDEEYDPFISLPVGESFRGPPAPVIEEVLTDERALDPSAQGDIAPAILVYATPGRMAEGLNGQHVPPQFLQARWRRSDRPNQRYRYTAQVPMNSPLTLAPVRPRKTYRVEVRAIGAAGETSKWTTEDNVTVLGLTAPPPQVDTFEISSIGEETTLLEWTYPSIAADVTGYQIRFHPDQAVTDWATMTVILDELPREMRGFSVPAREGSYAIKAIDVTGTLSSEATFVSAPNNDPDDLRNRTRTTYTEHPAFDDAAFNAVVDGTLLVLADNGHRVEDFRKPGFDGVGLYYFGTTDITEIYAVRLVTDPKVDRVSALDVMADWTTLAAVTSLAGDASDDEHRVWVEYSYSRQDVSPRTDPEAGLGTPDFTRAQGETIDTGALVTRNDDFTFVIDLKFPDGPTGTILELGGATHGLYCGITGSQMVIRAGDGTSRASTGCAFETQALSNYAGKHGRLYGRVDVSAGSVDLMFTDYATLQRVSTTTTGGGQVASAGFPSGQFTGTSLGTVGAITGTVMTGEDGGTFNGTIYGARFYNSSYPAIGNAGPTDWSDWRRMPGRVDLVARHVRMRVVLLTRDTGITPAIEELVARIKTRPQTQTGEDVASGTGGYAITFSPAFERLRTVVITPQSMSTGDYYTVTSKSRTGATVEFFNSSGTSVDRTFDWVAHGWGTEYTP